MAALRRSAHRWLPQPSSILGLAAIAAFAAGLVPYAAGEGFLGGPRSGRQAVRVSLKARSEELQAAMGAVLGCSGPGGPGTEPRQQAGQALAREALQPIWRTLPKNVYGRVEWKLLRYMAHRHFTQRYSLMVRGLEPMRKVNASNAGAAEVLSEQIPALAQQMLDGPRAEHGFSLDDAAAIVAAVEQLIFGADETILETIYKEHGFSPRDRLNKKQLGKVLTDWMVHWMLGEDEEGARMLAANHSLLEHTIPHWHEIASMVDGSVRAAEFAQGSSSPDGHQVMEGRHSFGDALNIVADIGRGFSSYWETECQVIKDSLIEMDTTATGRIPLTDFYGANMDGEWRFGESEAYLRELGALDETSPWRGTQVIIPNYLQGASNCIVSRPHYLVCCVNECEHILVDLEAAVGEPVATPETILELIGNMTDYSDDPVALDETLRTQLMRVAQTHGGKVPLHGRLFAQWLHYVFPRECAFPHKVGAVSPVTPAQFGDEYMVSEDEVSKAIAEKKAQNDLKRRPSKVKEQEQEQAVQWMTQWSEEEELPGDYSVQLTPPWQRSSHSLAAGGAVAASAAAVVGLLWAGGAKDNRFAAPAASSFGSAGSLPQAQGVAPARTHFV